ncbi:hypothetical protein GLOIN_2v1597509, partial [Rhizophagus irregularis DAOM 181602=DAOM 197198]
FTRFVNKLLFTKMLFFNIFINSQTSINFIKFFTPHFPKNHRFIQNFIPKII